MSERRFQLVAVVALGVLIVVSLAMGGVIFKSAYLGPDRPRLSCTELSDTPDESVEYRNLSDRHQRLIRREVTGETVYLNDTQEAFFREHPHVRYDGSSYSCVPVIQ